MKKPSTTNLCAQMKLRDTLDKIQENQQGIQVDLAEIRKDVNYHIKRTDLLEELVASNKRETAPLIETYNFIKVFGLLLVSGAALAAILRLFL